MHIRIISLRLLHHCIVNEKDHKQSVHQLTEVDEFCLKNLYAYCTMLIHLKRVIENKNVVFLLSVYLTITFP